MELLDDEDDLDRLLDWLLWGRLSEVKLNFWTRVVWFLGGLLGVLRLITFLFGI